MILGEHYNKKILTYTFVFGNSIIMTSTNFQAKKRD